MRPFTLAALVALLLGIPGAAQAEHLHILSFNMWHGGEGSVLPLKRTAEVIRASHADVVGVQEAYGRERDGVRADNSKQVAEMLGWHHVDQGNGKTILSRHEIMGLTPGKHGAEIKLPSGESFHLFNVHLYHAPYQPYQLLKIPYEDAPFLSTPEELVQAAQAARGEELAATLAEMKPLVEQGARVALTGDFNEPSHLDWTAKAVAAGTAPMVVAYRASIQAAALGLVDTYRNIHIDEAISPGYTWTPTTKPDDPADHHDRIDFVYVTPNLHVTRCQIVGEAKPAADIVVKPYPSDHRAVLTTVRLNP
jgi:exodeoxyribonuclease-3